MSYDLPATLLLLLRQALQERSVPAPASEVETLHMQHLPQEVFIDRLHAAALQISA